MKFKAILVELQWVYRFDGVGRCATCGSTRVTDILQPTVLLFSARMTGVTEYELRDNKCLNSHYFSKQDILARHSRVTLAL